MNDKQIPLDRLHACRKLITHANCSDGIASAIVVRYALPGIEVEFVQYGAPSREQLEPERGLLFVDMTPPRERALEFAQAGAIVLDHHKAQRDVVGLFGPLGVYADNESDFDERAVSGAALAYLHVWGPMRLRGMLDSPHVQQRGAQIAELARLVGVRDTWFQESPDWTLAEHVDAVLKFKPVEAWLGSCESQYIEHPRLPTDDDLEFGRLIYEDRLRRAKQCADRAVSFKVGEVSVAMFNDTAYLASNAADILAERGHEITIGFQLTCYDRELKLNLNLRSRKDSKVDLGALAREFGGGGHVHAAGFTKRAPDESPFEWIAREIGLRIKQGAQS